MRKLKLIEHAMQSLRKDPDLITRRTLCLYIFIEHEYLGENGKKIKLIIHPFSQWSSAGA